MKKTKSIDKLISEVLLSSPLSSTNVTSGFGPRWGRLHNGIDLKANLENVKTPLDGIVTKGEFLNDPCGGTIIIKHADGFQTGYCHMSRINVKPGDTVKKGDVIGVSGGGANDYGKGRSTGRHLHFTLRKDGKSVDPMKYIDKVNVSSIGFEKLDSEKSSEKIDWDAYFDDKLNSTKKPTTSSRINDPLLASILSKLSVSDFLKKEIHELTKPVLKEITVKDGKKSTNYEYIFKDQTPIYAVADGEVDLAEKTNKCDEELRVEHEVGDKVYFTRYCNVKKLKVRQGERVKKGKIMGYATTRTVATLLDRYKSEIKWSTWPDERRAPNAESPPPPPPQAKSGDPLLNLILSPLSNANIMSVDDITSPTDKEENQPKPYSWVDKIKKGSPTRVEESIKKIKRLLK